VSCPTVLLLPALLPSAACRLLVLAPCDSWLKVLGGGRGSCQCLCLLGRLQLIQLAGHQGMLFHAGDAVGTGLAAGDGDGTGLAAGDGEGK
jgi:hypothetical protein